MLSQVLRNGFLYSMGEVRHRLIEIQMPNITLKNEIYLKVIGRCRSEKEGSLVNYYTLEVTYFGFPQDDPEFKQEIRLKEEELESRYYFSIPSFIRIIKDKKNKIVNVETVE